MANQNSSDTILRGQFPSKCEQSAEIKNLVSRMREGATGDLMALAALRGLSIHGVALASKRGLAPLWVNFASTRRGLSLMLHAG